MSAKRKRNTSKKHSRVMETVLEQHRDEINEAAEAATETPPTDTEKTDTATGTISEPVSDSVPSSNTVKNDDSSNNEPIEEQDTEPTAPDAEAQNDAASTDSVDVDDKHDGTVDDTVTTERSDDDTDTNGNYPETASKTDLRDEKDNPDTLNDNHVDDDDGSVEHDATVESTEASTNNITDNTENETGTKSDTNPDNSSSTKNVTALEEPHGNTDSTVDDETRTDAANEQHDESDNKTSNKIIHGTDSKTPDIDVPIKHDTAPDDDQNTTEISSGKDNETDSSSIGENVDVKSDKIIDTKTNGGGSHFATIDVTDVINDSIEQAQNLVDSLTGKSKSDDDNGTHDDGTDKNTVPDIGVEIKSADEIAASVIGNDDNLKKTIAKLDEMIDEETSKTTAEYEKTEETATTSDGNINDDTANTVTDDNTESSSDNVDDNGDEPREAFTKPIADWIRNTAASIMETVSEKIEETKEAHEKAKAEKEERERNEQEAKENEKAKNKENAANASLTINESENDTHYRNALTADEACELTDAPTNTIPETISNGDKHSTKPSDTHDTVSRSSSTSGKETDDATNTVSETEDAANGETGETWNDEKPQPRTSDRIPQQSWAPYPYRHPSRRERRRAQRAYYGHDTEAAFNRNAYHPDTNRIYAIDPRSYASMRTPIMPDGTPIDPRRIVVIDAANAPKTLRQGIGLETADGRYISKKQGSGAAIAILVIAMLMSGATAAIVTGLATGTTSSTKSVIQSVADNINEVSKQPAGEAFKNAEASVVSVYSYQATSSYGFGIFGYDPSADENDSSTVMSGIGSGIVISANGDIITNAHIVNGYSDIMVKIGEKEYSASIVGKDDESDLAVIHVEGATDLQPLSFADSSKVGIGDVASTIGAPYGYDKTLSNGIISAINTNGTYETTDGMPMYISLFQTDAVVNAQNAGGALVDSSGNLIGINVQTKGSAGGHGLSFAIPSNYAKKVADQILESGEAMHGRIGVELRTDDSGAVAVYSVSKGSSASTAGMKAGDVIMSVGSSRIKSPSDFMMAIEEQPIGEYASIKIKRDGTEQTLKVKVEAGEATQKVKVDGKESTKG